eukprot:CAMPEP_0177629652 /NCGR_PEP_ID=MMETSP0447-20121125/783_1 /TAXON_ID=0 /ORGANISM="Stygamoeba regulata, Strain BSH-02190019" /LENGTH=176 /DNA_ID=CAMNT_0019130989 /DNA_START=503 /DNA_END=1033 /DNA_ORIENTATION=+
MPLYSSMMQCCSSITTSSGLTPSWCEELSEKRFMGAQLVVVSADSADQPSSPCFQGPTISLVQNSPCFHSLRPEEDGDYVSHNYYLLLSIIASVAVLCAGALLVLWYRYRRRLTNPDNSTTDPEILLGELSNHDEAVLRFEQPDDEENENELSDDDAVVVTEDRGAEVHFGNLDAA